MVLLTCIIYIFSLFAVFILLRYFFNNRNKKISIIDPLTKLGNRESFDIDLQNMKKEFALFYCDLDNFKQLNDTAGHKVGDELLKLVAKIWKDINICKHTVYRQGGDEFCVIAEGTKGQIQNLAEEMLLKLEKEATDEFSYITASIGIALYPEDTKDLDELKKYADTTMYVAKNEGKNKFLFFNNEIYNKIITEYKLDKIAFEVLKSLEFDMVYQPQWDIYTHKLYGFEALIRIQDNNTQDFILTTEKNGTIFEIDFKILKRVLEETKPLLKLNPELIFSINVSGKHLSKSSFFTEVYKIITDLDYPMGNIKFEITETAAVKNIATTASKIKKLKNLGIKIALDDFGSGYSNLKYLIDLNIDSLKIDKDFISTIKKDARLIKFIIELGHLIGCKIMAEGVEEEYQLDVLLSLGCDYIQGFIWGLPVSISDAREIVKKDLEMQLKKD